MSMKKIRAEMMALVEKELELANENNPPFHSPHEGYAVLLEEVEEMQDAIINVDDRTHSLWMGIKDNGNTFFDVTWIHDAAINAACEAIQVAAMCRKYSEMDNSGGQHDSE